MCQENEPTARCPIEKVTENRLQESRCLIIYVTQGKGDSIMSTQSKQEYLAEIRKRYLGASKSEKQRILNEFCLTCDYNRKYAIRLLHKTSLGVSGPRHPGRKKKYRDIALLGFLEALWIATNLACSKRLKVMIPLWLPHYPHPLSEHTKRLLRTISHSTIDRLLAPRRSKHQKLGLATTKPGSLLKKHIPIKTNQWDESRVGFLEADTVAHCGTSVAGNFIYTVNTVDIATGWTEQRAIWCKGEQGVIGALTSIEQSLPFKIRGFDCDNGGEFLNWTVFKYWAHRRRPVHYTRSREYKKNDNAHIEGKNWTHVRQYLGYERLDQLHLVAQLNDLYTSEWRLLLNFFLPSVKLIDKQRKGSKTIKTYDVPKTPLLRALESSDIQNPVKEQLRSQLISLNPFTLQHIMKKKIKNILKQATPTTFIKKVS